jgi:hypothetical protein
VYVSDALHPVIMTYLRFFISLRLSLYFPSLTLCLQVFSISLPAYSPTSSVYLSSLCLLDFATQIPLSTCHCCSQGILKGESIIVH